MLIDTITFLLARDEDFLVKRGIFSNFEFSFDFFYHASHGKYTGDQALEADASTCLKSYQIAGYTSWRCEKEGKERRQGRRAPEIPRLRGRENMFAIENVLFHGGGFVGLVLLDAWTIWYPARGDPLRIWVLHKGICVHEFRGIVPQII